MQLSGKEEQKCDSIELLAHSNLQNNMFPCGIHIQLMD